jgi:glucose/mannose transport system substrate-binding protein
MRPNYFLLFILATANTHFALAAPTAEVLHWWTSGGEAQALTVLKKDFEKAGGVWIDVPIAGGGGDTARSVLKSRFVAGNPPVAAQMHMGPQVWDWGKENALTDIDPIANAGHWDALLPKIIQDRVKYNGKYVAVPVNVHRVNWMWINPKALKKVGAAPPATWEEFNVLAEKLQKAGIIPLAHGGQPWQDVTLFESVVLGIGGADFYRKAFIDMDTSALGSPTMVKVFDQMRKLKSFTDKSSSGRDWNLATAMVVKGDAAIQIMGDWVKAEFSAAGQKADRDYWCVATPGARGAFSVNNDSFAMFKVKGDDKNKGQTLLANLVMGETFQEAFNVIKGSIPARQGVPRQRFDACAIKSMDDFIAANKKGISVPSLSSGGIPDAVAGAVADVVTTHFNSNMGSQEAVAMLTKAVEGSKAE